METERITWLMPEVASLAMGGFKVVFEYSNRLVADGYEVCIVLPTSLITGSPTMKKIVRKWLRFIFYKFCKNPKPDIWFKMHPDVKFHLTPSLSHCYIPSSDIYIATAMQTAVYLNEYKTDAKKYYFIQGYEFWAMGEEKLKETFGYNMQKLVISQYLESKIPESIRVPNAFDFTKFSTTNPIRNRNKYLVSTMYHIEPLKGFYDVKKAIEIVRNKYPEVELHTFGSFPVKHKEEYIKYIANPTPQELCEFYNNSSIYVGASHSEGWGLTVGEAMICSLAVACTDTGGYLEMAKDGQTALVSSIGNVKKLAENIIRLIEDDSLREKIANNGAQFITQFTWDKSYKRLKRELKFGTDK